MWEPYDENKPIGYFPEPSLESSRIPIWSPLIFQIKKLIFKNSFKRQGPFKFVPIAFEKISIPNENIYTPIYILVPENLTINFDETPEFIPMLL